MKLKTIILFLLLATSLNAQSPQFNTSQYRGAFAKEKLTVSNSVKTFTSSVYAPTSNCPTTSLCHADYAVVTVENTTVADCMRYWMTSDNPTVTDGHRACDSNTITIWGYSNIKNFKAIRITSDVTIQVSYYRFLSNSF